MSDSVGGNMNGAGDVLGYFIGLAGGLAIIWWLYSVAVEAWDASYRAGWLP